MTSPRANILRDNPRKVLAAGALVCLLSLIGGQLIGLLLGIGVTIAGIMLCAEDKSYQLAQRLQWKEYYAALDRDVAELERLDPERVAYHRDVFERVTSRQRRAREEAGRRPVWGQNG